MKNVGNSAKQRLALPVISISVALTYIYTVQFIKNISEAEKRNIINQFVPTYCLHFRLPQSAKVPGVSPGRDWLMRGFLKDKQTNKDNKGFKISQGSVSWLGNLSLLATVCGESPGKGPWLSQTGPGKPWKPQERASWISGCGGFLHRPCHVWLRT